MVTEENNIIYKHNISISSNRMNDWHCGVNFASYKLWTVTELSVSTFAPFYNTLVRPHLEYAIHTPNRVADADCLGQIPRRRTRLVKCLRRLPYEERLHWLGLHSLNRRRLREDLIAAYKVYPGALDLEPRFFYTDSAARVARSSFQISAGS